jgi:F-type H+-transporting ATPase subunit b
MDIVGKLGLDPVLLVAQIVNFLIIAFLLWRFLLKPLMARMAERAEKISKGLADAEAAARAREEAVKERDAVLGAAHAEASGILGRARVEAERIRAAGAEAARAEAERTMADARARIQHEQEEAERQVEGYSLELSQRLLEKVVGSLLTPEESKKIASRAAELIRSGG